jgi:hypothetical protein
MDVEKLNGQTVRTLANTASRSRVFVPSGTKSFSDESEDLKQIA